MWSLTIRSKYKIAHIHRSVIQDCLPERILLEMFYMYNSPSLAKACTCVIPAWKVDREDAWGKLAKLASSGFRKTLQECVDAKGSH